MTAEAIPDLSIERLVYIDQRIDQHEGEALRDRWEFGVVMLAERDGMDRLPNGYMTELVNRTGKSRSELGYRVQFAEKYQTELELSNALDSFTSWRELVKSFKKATPITEPPRPTILQGQYGTILADPPWAYDNTSTRGAAEDHYGTMTIEELCDLPIARQHAADQSHLYLWTTAGHLPEAFKVIEAWGFEYKTYLVWIKPQMGMGNYFRISTELILFGTRGGLRTTQRNIMNYFTAKRGKHSAKPQILQDIITKTSPGPYLEMFTRCYAEQMLTGCHCSKCRLGWETWGNQS